MIVFILLHLTPFNSQSTSHFIFLQTHYTVFQCIQKLDLNLVNNISIRTLNNGSNMNNNNDSNLTLMVSGVH